MATNFLRSRGALRPAPGLVVYVLALLGLGWSFNVDTRRPTVFARGHRSGSYFGFSVGLLRNERGNWLLVGAPLDQKEGERKGALYMCKIPPNETQMCENSGLNTEQKSGSDIIAKTDNQWLGVSLDVDPSSQKVSVCGHRWKRILSRKPNFNGICIEAESEFTSSPEQSRLMMPFSEKDNQFKTIANNLDVYWYSVSFTGASLHYSKDGSSLLMGSPGVYQGKGGFAIYSGKKDGKPLIADYSKADENKIFWDDRCEFCMTGYAITSGQFYYNDIHVAVGSPGLSTNANGAVLLYFETVFFQRYEGTQFGSFFGASLCAADVNGDGFDDLIVGAPMQHVVYDEGRVHVLISNGRGSLVRDKQLSGQDVIGARFGTALGNLQDFNMDGYEDVAVGAPYEGQDRQGVVYIYYGGPNGLSEFNKLRIPASSLDDQLRGFGISFSRPLDVDGNSYKDFAVGSFLSDQTVLLFGAPIVHFHANISVFPQKINPETSNYLNVTICMKYYGKSMIEEEDVQFTLNMDVEKEEKDKRVGFEDAMSRKLQSQTRLKNNTTKCFNYQLVTKLSDKIYEPIVFSLNLDLITNQTVGLNGLPSGQKKRKCKICPVQDWINPAVFQKKVLFVGECSLEKDCYADLVLDAIWGGENNVGENILLIGGSTHFNVTVDLNNTEESAYSSNMVVEYPIFVKFSQIKKLKRKNLLLSCEPRKLNRTTQETNLLNCSLGTILRNGHIQFVLYFETANVSESRRDFNMNFTVNTKRKEYIKYNNRDTVQVKMKKKSNITVSGVSNPEVVVIDKANHCPNDSRREQAGSRQVEHEYNFYNNGPSDLKHAAVILGIPDKYTAKRQLFYIEQINYTFHGDIQVICLLENKTTDLKISTLSSSLEASEMIPNQSFVCSFSNWPAHSTFLLKAKVKLSVTLLQHVEVSKLPEIETIAILPEISDDYYVHGKAIQRQVYKVQTKLETSVPETEPVKSWVIIVGIVVGVVCLCVAVFVLWKCGFFKRKRKHKVQDVKDDAFEFEPKGKDEDQPDS